VKTAFSQSRLVPWSLTTPHAGLNTSLNRGGDQVHLCRGKWGSPEIVYLPQAALADLCFGRELAKPAIRRRVEIFHKGNRIASHLRSRRRGQAITQNEHRPKSHQAHLEWTPSRMVNWARSIGPNTAQLFERILNEKPHPEMGYRSCLGIIRLAQQYSRQRMEAAAERALLAQACRYQSVKSILKNSLDVVPLSPPQPGSPPLTHDNVRGAEYFDQGGPTSC